MFDLFGLSPDVWPWAWLLVAVALFVVELAVLRGSPIVLSFGVSAAFASLMAFGSLSAGIQWTVFLLGGSVLFLVIRRYQSPED